jgi:hypothetical protein
LLKRLDTLLAAALLAFGLRVIPDRWLCAEVTCQSPRDAVVLALFTVTVALGIAFVLWHVTGRWWTRVLVLVAAVYASNQLPVWLGRRGTWNIAGESGTRCEVTYGMRQDEVRRRCGAPAFWCEGPKHIEALNQWNPTALLVCSFRGDVYGDRLITYGCAGGVASVVATSGDPPEKKRPAGCVSWGR